MIRLTAVVACLVDGALGVLAFCGEQATLGFSLTIGLMSMLLQLGFSALHSVFEIWEQP